MFLSDIRYAQLKTRFKLDLSLRFIVIEFVLKAKSMGCLSFLMILYQKKENVQFP